MTEMEDRLRAALRARVESTEGSEVPPLETTLLEAPDHGGRGKLLLVCGAAFALLIAGLVATRPRDSGPMVSPPSLDPASSLTAVVDATPPSKLDKTASTSKTEPIAPVPIPKRPTVALDGDELVWFASDGGEITRSSVHTEYGFGPGIAGVTKRVVVQVGGQLEIYDPDDPRAEPIRAGPYINLGAVVVDDGYWAGDPLPSGQSWIWRRYDWTGKATSVAPIALRDPDATSDPPLLVPIAEVNGGLVVESRETSSILHISSDEIVDLGPGRFGAAGPPGVVLIQDRALWFYEAGTDDKILLADELPTPTLAQTYGAGAINPAGTQVALLFADEHTNEGSTLLIADLDAPNSARQVDLPAPRSTRIDWLGDQHVLASGSMGSGRTQVVNTTAMSVEAGSNVPQGVQLYVTPS